MIPQTCVVFAVPSGAHAPKLAFWQSTMAAQAEMMSRGITQVWISTGGDPYLDKVRDRLASQALRNYPQMTHFFFIDDDVGFPPEAAIDLINAPFDVCAGVYPKKHDDPQFPVNLLMDETTMKLVERDGFYRASSVPTGFLCIKAHVLRAQAEKAPKYRDLDGSVNWSIFRTGFRPEPRTDGTDGQYWGEDPDWCRRYIEAGGEIWVKPDIEFTHTGTKTWRGTLMDRVRTTNEGTPAWNPDGMLAFFPPGAEIPEGWTTRKPEPAALAAD